MKHKIPEAHKFIIVSTVCIYDICSTHIGLNITKEKTKIIEIWAYINGFTLELLVYFFINKKKDK